ncbi:hypothetical protein I7I51_08457 [Histoplasma capsulatum]|uniref:Uncharacterized protein n=1 Tax=Ajellomyces capsulatus TaxID=5037 RepID=A0A8A1M0E4_AJECA|nr:hypothetical protein I7I51_08457 [Histoplasma capsulatum]
MSAAYVSSQFIQNVARPSGFSVTHVKSDFVGVVEKNLDSLRPDTAIVAMNWVERNILTGLDYLYLVNSAPTVVHGRSQRRRHLNEMADGASGKYSAFILTCF